MLLNPHTTENDEQSLVNVNTQSMPSEDTQASLTASSREAQETEFTIRLVSYETLKALGHAPEAVILDF